jgi:Helix-turn-helix domain
VAELDDLRRWAAASYRMRAIPPADRRKIRELAGVSRAVLADMLGVTWDRVRSYETGSFPTGEDAARYLDALDAMSAPYATAMDAGQRADMVALFENHKRDYPPTVCEHCKGVHWRACPRVRRLVYDEHRRVAEVEYWPDGEWSRENIVFYDGPEMAADDGES